ncbi:MAG: sulfatase-like hydrolase/transferase [Actinomycetota bacterium]
MRERLDGVGRLSPLSVLASVLGVGAFALGQPLLDLVGRNPEFFIARRFPAPDIVVLAAGLLAAPAVLALPILALRRAGPVAAGAVHLVVLALLAAVAAATVLLAAGAGTWAWPLFFVVTALLGVGLAAAYARFGVVQSGVAILGLAPLVFGIWFATATPVSGILSSGRSDVPEAADASRPVPVVMVVFDEFPLASVMLQDGSLNREGFPALSRLAEDGTWYRNAVGVHQQTEEAVPAMLVGREVDDGSIPTTGDHPFTLFSLLSEEYDVQAVENVTRLCPEYICGNVSQPVEEPARRWRSVAVDLAVVYGHMVLPEDLTGELPPIDQGWGRFRPAAAAGGEDFDIIERFVDEVSQDRRRDLGRFLDTFETPGEEPPLRFAHFLYPHHPWELTADGRIHGAGRPPGRDSVGWGDDEYLVAQGWQRHLIQARWADTMLGRVLDRMEEEGWYEEAMVVVVADHGITVRPGTEHQRTVTDETFGSIAYIPLFVKYPSSFAEAPTPGTVDDARAETIDILPTVTEVIGVDVPWQTDGLSLTWEEVRGGRSSSVMRGTQGPVQIPPGIDALMEVVEAHTAWFPDGDPYRLTPPGWQALLGTDVRGGVDQSDLSLTLDQTELLAEYRPGGEPVPSFLSGTVAVPGSGGRDAIVAVAVDDEVVAVTRSYAANDGTPRWEAMIDPAHLDRSRDVEVWLVRGSASDPSFVR